MTTRVSLERVPVPKVSPLLRVLNYEEVNLCYSAEQAVTEASRCLQCPKKPCTEGCPVGVDIPNFIKGIRDGNLAEAVRVIKTRNSLPAICGRVCPQETQCEKRCTLGKKGAAIAIGQLERYVADWELEDIAGRRPQFPIQEPTDKNVAIVGSGPAGLTAAGELAKLGHRVVIFEALHAPGGVLVYGIPEFRLPKSIVQAEVEYIKSLGVELVLNCVVGKAITVDELFQDNFHAIFLGTGAGLPMFLNIPGENLSGVCSANEFLTRVNLMKAYLFPTYLTPVEIGDRVAVIGGGNVAMDAARCALRLGAHEVRVIYRRSRDEMPARHEEAENAEAEGVIFQFLTAPQAFLDNGKGTVNGIQCFEMELGEPDANGRRQAVTKPGSEFKVDTDTVIVALGTTPNPMIPMTTGGLQTTSKGTVIAEKESGLTTRQAIWAGGDLTTGGATVISAMGGGKRAAASIQAFLAKN